MRESFNPAHVWHVPRRYSKGAGICTCHEPSAVSELLLQAHVWRVLRRYFKDRESCTCHEPTAVSESCEQAHAWHVLRRYFKEREITNFIWWTWNANGGDTGGLTTAEQEVWTRDAANGHIVLPRDPPGGIPWTTVRPRP